MYSYTYCSLSLLFFTDPTAEKPASSPTPPIIHSTIPSIAPTVTVIGGDITSKPRQTPACTGMNEMSSSDIALPVVAVVAVGIIVVLLAVITVLIVLLRRKTEAKNALDPLPHPMGRAGINHDDGYCALCIHVVVYVYLLFLLCCSLLSVDATNPATDNGSVVYETIQSKTTQHFYKTTIVIHTF